VTHSERANELQSTLAGNDLPILDGYRAIGVIVVMAEHFGYVGAGGLALTGFFALSGFLITWLLRKEHRATGTVSVRRFYVRRMLRILPAYYVYVVVSLLLLIYLGKQALPYGMVSASLGYVANYYNAFNGHPPGPFAHLWSLAVEEQFYLLWPVLFVLLARRGRKPLAAFLVTSILCVLVWRSAVYLVSGNIAYVYNAFDTRFDALAVGCLLAVCVEHEKFRWFVATITRWSWLPLVTLAVAWPFNRPPLRFTLGFTMQAVLIALLLVQLVTLHRSRLWSWVQHPMLRYMGGISYPMYLYHQWGIGLGDKATMLPAPAQFVIGVLATTVAAMASYHFIERPFLRLKKHFEPRGLGISRPLPDEILLPLLSPRLQVAHATELQQGERFAFGDNWNRFLRIVDEQRIAQAERSIQEMLGVESLRNRTFLDVGSGSGLFSLAARRLGARVHSFDYDTASVACTAELRRQFFPNDPHWTVEQGSVLDRDYVHSLGTYDIVYAWGVLHHTGAMWQALDNIVPTVAPGGRLFVAIYNDQGIRSSRWRRVKQIYCSGPVGRALVSATFIPAFALRDLAADLVWRRNPLRRYAEYKRNRGMSVVRDWCDWLGGYPFEVAKPEQVFDFYRDRRLHLNKLKTCGGSVGCNEFIFERSAEADDDAMPVRRRLSLRQ
jgi:peptidoglycan/LPS O-acetylase OafA/YrhL/2-polyprenyl-3-methyl-5-hydroxy-6-metoxy-1,4-benzoquinol methylase